MKPEDRRAIETAWSIRLPSEFGSDSNANWDALRLPGGSQFDVPWPLLTPSEIAGACKLADEWQIPEGLVPFCGDFHDLICLDYRNSAEPTVVAVNDQRQTVFLFPDFRAFLAARFLRDASPSRPRDVVSSRLDFLGEGPQS